MYRLNLRSIDFDVEVFEMVVEGVVIDVWFGEGEDCNGNGFLVVGVG